MLDRTGNKADENTINMVQELSVSTPLHFGILVVFLVYDSDNLLHTKLTLELLLLLLVSGSIPTWKGEPHISGGSAADKLIAI